MFMYLLHNIWLNISIWPQIACPSLLGRHSVSSRDLNTDSSRITLTLRSSPQHHIDKQTYIYLPQPPSTHYPPTLIRNPSEVNQKVPGHKVMSPEWAWYPTLATGWGLRWLTGRGLVSGGDSCKRSDMVDWITPQHTHKHTYTNQTMWFSLVVMVKRNQILLGRNRQEVNKGIQGQSQPCTLISHYLHLYSSLIRMTKVFLFLW